RPKAFSSVGVRAFWSLFVRKPLTFLKLCILILRIALSSPREALTLMGNIQCISYFARCLKERGIFHIHAGFLSWPACMALAVSVVSGCTFSIAAHARDLFVEYGAVNLKASHARFITTCTHQGLEHLQKILPKQLHHKLHLNYHGINWAQTDAVSDLNKSNKTILAVGRLVEKKGFANLIKAFGTIHKRCPEYMLQIVGEGPLQNSIADLIEKLSLSGKVEMMGWQEHRITLEFIRQATILVVPSIVAVDEDRDGIPNVIFEAIALETPIIASDLPAICEVLEHRKTGLLATAGNPAKLASLILELIKDKGLQNNLTQNALEGAEKRFDLFENSNQLAQLFKDIA
ncbi:hypothetical protein LCGC14_2954970, partial [marine sediment metagenome]